MIFRVIQALLFGLLSYVLNLEGFEFLIALVIIISMVLLEEQNGNNK